MVTIAAKRCRVNALCETLSAVLGMIVWRFCQHITHRFSARIQYTPHKAKHPLGLERQRQTTTEYINQATEVLVYRWLYS